MRCEWPEVKRCLCCLPLRPGLIGAGYIKLILNPFIIIIVLSYAIQNFKYRTTTDVFLTTTFTVYMVLDLIFHTILLIGAHKKNHRIITIYFRYCIAVFAVNCIFSIAFVVYIITINILHPVHFVFIMLIFYYVMFFLSILLINIGITLYLMILVRSEIIKLKNNQQYQFINRTEALYVEALNDDKPANTQVIIGLNMQDKPPQDE